MDELLEEPFFKEEKNSLTIEEFRKFPGCENYTDEQTIEIISSLDQAF